MAIVAIAVALDVPWTFARRLDAVVAGHARADGLEMIEVQGSSRCARACDDRIDCCSAAGIHHLCLKSASHRFRCGCGLRVPPVVKAGSVMAALAVLLGVMSLSLIHISEPTRL